MGGVVTAHSLMRDGRFKALPGGILEGFTADVDLPVGARVVAAGLLHGVPALWVAGPGSPGVSTRHYVAVSDGVSPDGIDLHADDHVWSIRREGAGDFAWHVFEWSGFRLGEDETGES